MMPAGDPVRTAEFLGQQSLPPYPFPEGSVVMVVNRNCPHCQDLLARSNYPTTTEDGRTIYYIDKATEAGLRFAEEHLGALAQGVPKAISVGPNQQLTVIGAGADVLMQQLFPMLDAQQRAVTALNTPGGGSTVPHSAVTAETRRSV